MAVPTPNQYWIRPDALTFSLNTPDVDYLRVSVLAGSAIIAYMEGVIDYDPSHNHRKWPIQAADTFLETTEPYYVHAQLTRSESTPTALIVYSLTKRSITGKIIEEDGTETGEEDQDYFYVYLGKISSSIDKNGQKVGRTWIEAYNPGKLDTNQGRAEDMDGHYLSKLFDDTASGLIRFLKGLALPTGEIKLEYKAVDTSGKWSFNEGIYADTSGEYPLGQQVATTGALASPFFDLQGADYIKFSLIAPADETLKVGLVFYDAEEKAIEGIYTNSNEEDGYVDREVLVPMGATKVRFTVWLEITGEYLQFGYIPDEVKTHILSSVLTSLQLLEKKEDIEEVKKLFTENTVITAKAIQDAFVSKMYDDTVNAIISFNKGVKLPAGEQMEEYKDFDISSLEIITNGVGIFADSTDAEQFGEMVGTDADMVSTDFIDLQKANYIDISLLAAKDEASRMGLVFYNAENAPIKGYYISGQEEDGYVSRKIAVPEGATQIRFSAWSIADETLYLKLGYFADAVNTSLISSLIKADDMESAEFSENSLITAAAFAKLFKLAKDDKGNFYIRTPYPLASDKTVSSLGIGSDGDGGVSYDRLDSWDNYDAGAGAVLSATLGYELKQAIENIDLGDINLTAYLTKEEASKTYATQDSLRGYQPLITADNSLAASLVSGLATVATSGKYSDLSGVPTKLSDFTDDIVNGKYQPLIDATNKLAYSLISGTPTKLSDFTDDVVNGHYQPLIDTTNKLDYSLLDNTPSLADFMGSSAIGGTASSENFSAVYWDGTQWQTRTLYKWALESTRPTYYTDDVNEKDVNAKNKYFTDDRAKDALKKTTDDLSARIAKFEKMFQWGNGEDSYVKTPYPLASDSTVSSLGIGSDGNGGVSYDRLDSWDNYVEGDGSVLSSYLGHGLLQRIEQLEDGTSGDFSDIEEKVDKNTNAITNLSISLNDFLTGVDVDDTINRWKELEKFLEDYTETATLAELLKGKQNEITANNKLSASLVNGLATVATSGKYSDLSGVPTKLSDFTDDVVNGHYQPLIDTTNKLDYSLLANTPLLADFMGSSAIGGTASSDNFSAVYWDGKQWQTRTIYKWALASEKPSYTTSEVTEGENLYFTDQRAITALEDITRDLSDRIAAYEKVLKIEDNGKLLHALVSFASDKTVSSLGIGSSEGGGVSYDRLDSWDNYDAGAGAVLSATLGYELKQAIENIDLGDFNLTAYLTKEEASKTYATQKSLSGYQPLITTNNSLAASLVSGLATVATSGKYSDLSGVPTKLSDFEDDVVNGHYQPLIDANNKLDYSLLANTPSLADFMGSSAIGGTASSDNFSAVYWDGTQWKTRTLYKWALASSKPSYKTSEVAEDGNLYFTTDRVKNCLTGAVSSVLTSNLTASRALISDASGKIAASAVTSTELGYLSGINGNIKNKLENLDKRIAAYETILKIEENNTLLHATVAFASDSTVSSLGVGTDEGGGGASVDILQDWDNYDEGIVMALGANLGYELNERFEELGDASLMGYSTTVVNGDNGQLVTGDAVYRHVTDRLLPYVTLYSEQDIQGKKSFENGIDIAGSLIQGLDSVNGTTTWSIDKYGAASFSSLIIGGNAAATQAFVTTQGYMKFTDVTGLIEAYAQDNIRGKYLLVSGGTLYNTNSGTPLYIKGGSTGAYIGFKLSNDTDIGDIGVNDTKDLIFGSNKVLHAGNTSFSAVLATGTKIGTITIGGTSTDLYAPVGVSADLSNYYTKEQVNSYVSGLEVGISTVDSKFANYYNKEGVHSYVSQELNTFSEEKLGTAASYGVTTSVTSGSTSLVTSGAVYTSINSLGSSIGGLNGEISTIRTLVNDHQGKWQSLTSSTGLASGYIKQLKADTFDLGGSVVATTDDLDAFGNTIDNLFARKTSLATVATSGSYNDLTNKPTIPSAITVTNNLTSTSTSAALSANQGRVLNNKFASYLPLSGGQMENNAGITWNNAYYNSDSVGSHLSVLADTTQGNSLATQAGYSYNTVLNIGGGGIDSYRFQFASYVGGGNRLYYRGYNANSNVWGNWVGIIHSGNIGSQSVESANKLSTARTIWGQSFDGSENVSGDIINAAGGICLHLTNEINCFNGDLHINYRGTGLTGYGRTGNIIACANGGSVMIGGTTADSGYKLYVNGNAYINGSLNYTSDEKLKSIVGDVRLSLSSMAYAPLVQFAWNNGIDSRLHVGTIAQYWEGCLPEVVSRTKGGTLALSYGELGVAMGISLATHLTETNDEVTKLKKRVEELENENKKLQERVDALVA